MFLLQNTPPLPAKYKVRVQGKREYNGSARQRPSPKADLSQFPLLLLPTMTSHNLLMAFVIVLGLKTEVSHKSV